MEETKKCPKCVSEMEIGKVDGVKKEGFLTALNKWYKDKKLFGLAIKDSKEITVFRCKTCGYLESYAK